MQHDDVGVVGGKTDEDAVGGGEGGNSDDDDDCSWGCRCCCCTDGDDVNVDKDGMCVSCKAAGAPSSSGNAPKVGDAGGEADTGADAS